MRKPRACSDCLRRSWLLANLAPYIEKTATAAPGSRAAELLRLSNEDLAATVAPKVAMQTLKRVAAVADRHLEAELVAAGCWACCRHEEAYPSGLRDATDAPWALICRGAPQLLERIEPGEAVTVVGSRRASSYGREVARQLGHDLAGAGLAVVSGMAFGIDACAHRGAVETGLTVAVLASGADVSYPAAHRSLWRRICERGLVISEMPPGTVAWRWAFPARNRIMAALAGMTVVVEAAERSGSLITTDLAADLGRDLGAVPGPVSSRYSVGPNNLLSGGACLVRGAQDVLDAMLGPGVHRIDRQGASLTPQLLSLLVGVERGGETCDELIADLQISGSEATAGLARLEAMGYVSCSAMGVYSRTMLQPPADVPPGVLGCLS